MALSPVSRYPMNEAIEIVLYADYARQGATKYNTALKMRYSFSK